MVIVTVAVQHDISRRCPALILGPAVAKAGFDFTHDVRERAVAFLGGSEGAGIAGVGARAIERAVLPSRQGNRCIEIVTCARFSDDAG
jgi:hypothetical protein